MKQDIAEILKKALDLPPEARAAIAGSLLDSLDRAVDEDAESEWENEVLLRLKDLEEGTVNPVPWAEARRRIART
jgi:putative addiction module component (TIGR02574 family)